MFVCFFVVENRIPNNGTFFTVVAHNLHSPFNDYTYNHIKTEVLENDQLLLESDSFRTQACVRWQRRGERTDVRKTKTKPNEQTHPPTHPQSNKHNKRDPVYLCTCVDFSCINACPGATVPVQYM